MNLEQLKESVLQKYPESFSADFFTAVQISVKKCIGCVVVGCKKGQKEVETPGVIIKKMEEGHLELDCTSLVEEKCFITDEECEVAKQEDITVTNPAHIFKAAKKEETD